MEKKRDQWASKIGFILAAAGSAVGLGNIWKFPGKAFAGGGGVYLLVYLTIVIFIGVPVMVSELAMGRKTGQNTIGTFRTLNKKFAWAGWCGIICAFVILCYYGHVGGWVIQYVCKYIFQAQATMDSGLGGFYNLLGYDAATGATWFPWAAIAFAALFMAINAFILIKGVSGGLEKVNKVGMPALFVILIILLVRSVTLPGAGEGLKYLVSVQSEKVNMSSTVISALGQAFYSLSLGMAIMITYGSYLSKKENIAKNSLIICGLDTLVAFLAGFIIIPAVFVTLGPDAVGKGAGFGFGGLCGVFKALPAGQLFAILFYLLLFFAAISSSTSIAEGIIAFLCEQFGWERKKTTIGLCVVCFAVGIIYTISQASVNIKMPWFDFKGITMVTAGDWMEFATDRLLLPLCALGESILVGWVIKPQTIFEEVTAEGNKFSWFKVYSFLIKYLCPIAIVAILAVSLITGTTVS